MQDIIQADDMQKDIMLRLFNDANRINGLNYIETSSSIFDDIFAYDTVFFLKKDSSYIGFYSYRIKQDHALLSSLYVALSYQRCGLGTYLLKDCEKKLQNNQIKLLIVSVLKQSVWALNFYQKQCFTLYETSIAPSFMRPIMQNYPDEPWSYFLYKELL